MPGFILDPMRRARAVQYLLLQWRPDDIARELHCGVDTIYRMQRNLWMYGAPYAPRRQTMGCPRKMTKRTEDLLIQFIVRNPTANQEEMTWFILWWEKVEWPQGTTTAGQGNEARQGARNNQTTTQKDQAR
jgi:transposase